MAGLVTSRPMAVFPHGFPVEITSELKALAGRDLIGNRPASGTAIIEELGAEHLATGALILYTSGDSVLQIAAHERVVPLSDLYRICAAARQIADRHRIGRVIARPFVDAPGRGDPGAAGQPGAFRRTYNRHDFAMVPPAPTLCDVLTTAGIPVVGVGKIADIFAGRGVPVSLHSEGNSDGMEITLRALDELPRGLLFVNLVDFDMLYGHRRDARGYRIALEEFDKDLIALEKILRPDDLVILSADHGNDPTKHETTDHTREYVPILVIGKSVKGGTNLGTRASLADIGATVEEALGFAPQPPGKSFLRAALAG
jgi:phosphopentomutase